MTSLKRTVRIAGLWYLGFTLGPFYLLYVPSQTVVNNDASATAARVLGHETLFRWGMLAETLGVIIFIGLSLALYRLFEDVDLHRARQLVALVLVSSALSLATVVFSSTALFAFRGGAAVAAFDEHTREAIGMLLISMHGQAIGINQTFWGFGCCLLDGWSYALAFYRAGWGTGSCLTASPGSSSASPGSSPRITLTLSSVTFSQCFWPSSLPCSGC
jgi:hypothetical protein